MTTVLPAADNLDDESYRRTIVANWPELTVEQRQYLLRIFKPLVKGKKTQGKHA